MNEEEFVADLADHLREDVLDEEFWGGWPICAIRSTHPLEAGVSEEGIAPWIGPRNGAVAAIGFFAAGPSPQEQGTSDPVDSDRSAIEDYCVLVAMRR